MSTLRVTRLRAIRPQLSLRYQALRRHESTNAKLPSDPTSTTATTTDAAEIPAPPPPAGSSQPPPPKPSFFRENRLLLITSALAISVGFLGTNFVLSGLNPPPFPEPGSEGDDILMADLQARIDTDFKVNVMRGKCLSAARHLKGSEAAGWVEVLPETYDAASAETSAQKPGFKLVTGGLLTQNLQGAGRLGVERIFYNRSTRELVSVVWFGGALSGWPGVTHGGLLATTLNEKIALAAALAEQDQRSNIEILPQNVLGAARAHARIRAPQSLFHPAGRSLSSPIMQLTMNYRKPTKANSFYVVRVTPTTATSDTAPTDKSRAPTQAYNATIEQLEGTVCVESQAEVEKSAEVPSSGGGSSIKSSSVKTVSERYTDFKQSMWPSRQGQTTMRELSMPRPALDCPVPRMIHGSGEVRV
jgi:hypothetical protein